MNHKDSVKGKVEERPQNKHLKPWPKGVSGNPAGMKVGTRSYKTLFRLAIQKLADKKGVPPDEFEEDLIANGVLRAFSDHRWYKDALDRLGHVPVQQVDVTTGGKEINAIGEDQMRRIAEELLNKKNK